MMYYGADTEQDRILRRTPSDGFSNWGTAGAGQGQFNRPTGVAVDADGYVYLADNSAQIVRKFDALNPSFREIARFGHNPVTVPRPLDPEELDDPVDLAVSTTKVAHVVDRRRKQIVRQFRGQFT